MIGFLLCGYLLGKTFYDIDKAIAYDDMANENYKNAFIKSSEAKKLLKEKDDFCYKRINNVIKKKSAIIKYSIPKFVEVYKKIQKVIINDNSDNKFTLHICDKDYTDSLKLLSSLKDNSFSREQLICGTIFKGIGKMIELDSKQNLASSQELLRLSNIQNEQLVSICNIYDTIILRVDKISDLLVQMNALFLLSINQTALTIEKNGYNIRTYDDYDHNVLMTCVNIARAIIDIIDIPISIFDQNGEISEAAIQLLSKGEQHLVKFQKTLCA